MLWYGHSKTEQRTEDNDTVWSRGRRFASAKRHLVRKLLALPLSEEPAAMPRPEAPFTRIYRLSLNMPVTP
jgi:hypothetical protein